MSVPQFFKNPFHAAPCDMYNCSNMAKWLVGQPDPHSLVNPGFLRLCNKCAINVVANLPDELLPHLPKKPDLEQIVNRRAFEVSQILLDEFVFVLQSGNSEYCSDVARKFREITGAPDPVAALEKIKSQHMQPDPAPKQAQAPPTTTPKPRGGKK